MNLFEVCVVVAILMILVGLVLTVSPPNHARDRARQLNCVNNLKQVGLAYRIWGGDHGDIFPTGISVTNGGSMEMVQIGNVAFTFQVISNEMGSAKIVYCPADTDRSWTTSFGSLANSNISYFIGVDVTNEAYPQAILSGDCNFEFAGKPVKPGLLSIWTNDPGIWAANRHVRRGNLSLGDGSVQVMRSAHLRDYFVQAGVATNRLAIP